MATRRVAAPTAQQRQLAAQQAQQQLALRNAGLGLVSPYDGSTPFPGVRAGAYPLEAGSIPGSLSGLDAGRPQVNATNQSALAPNGDINQNVTNENKYENKYYNVISSPYGSGGGAYNPYFPQNGGWGGWGNGMGNGWGNGQQCFIDPNTGAMICQDGGGIFGWFKRLFRGY